MTIANMNSIISLLTAIGGALLIALVVLMLIYLKLKRDDKNSVKEIVKEKKSETTGGESKAKEGKVKQYTICSVFDFMNFEKIEDNMIVQKNGKRYLMVIDCQGINYDLMSEEEKVGVEAGFIQLLNTLQEPIQMYVQTRKVNLEGSLQQYNKIISQIESSYRKQNMKYTQLSQNSSVGKDVLKKEYLELVKQKNLYEYGKDIIYNTERMSLNKNILTKKYYIVLSYYPDEEDGKLDKEELRENAFSELYTRAQSLIGLLSVSNVIGRIMDSTELADLLYVSFNREDSDVLGVDKAIKAKYDELYTTAPDYMKKKIEILDKEIERKAYDKANESIVKVQSKLDEEYKEKQTNVDDVIDNLAKLIIEQNAETIGENTAERAKEEIDAGKEQKKGGQ